MVIDCRNICYIIFERLALFCTACGGTNTVVVSFVLNAAHLYRFFVFSLFIRVACV